MVFTAGAGEARTCVVVRRRRVERRAVGCMVEIARDGIVVDERVVLN